MRNGGRNKSNGEGQNDKDDHSDGTGPDLRAGMDIVVARSSQARAQFDAWKKSLSRQAKDHPARTLAIALGAGYLVGGGLFSRLTGRLVGRGLRLGLRLAVIPFVTSSLASIGEGMFSRGKSDAEDASGTDAAEPGSATRQRHSRNNSNQKETRT